MPIPIAAAIAGGAALASSAANLASDVNRNDVQLKLSRTAHQREVADLRAAGLNPILSATGGRGAPMADLSAPHIDLGGAVNSALAAADAKSSIDLKTAQANSARSVAEGQDIDNRTKMQTQELAIEQARLNVINSGLDRETKRKLLNQYDAQTGLLRLQISASARDVARQLAEESYYKGPGGKVAPFNKWLGSVLHSGKALSDAMGNNLRNSPNPQLNPDYYTPGQ